MTSAIFAIIVLIVTPQGVKPVAPPFIFETRAECEVTRIEGDKRMRQDPDVKFIFSYCVVIGGEA